MDQLKKMLERNDLNQDQKNVISYAIYAQEIIEKKGEDEFREAKEHPELKEKFMELFPNSEQISMMQI